MKRVRLSALFFASFLFSLPATSQVAFFQPLTFTGCSSFVADFNGDGKPDLLCFDGTLNLGNGDGTFKPGTNVSGTVLAVADFNGDGKPDLLEQGTGTLLVLLGNGDGTFQSPISTNSGAALSLVAAADLNGDGKADVVGIFNSSLYVYIGNGDGTFKAAVPYNLGVTPTPAPVLSIGDFNGDQKVDVVVSTAGNAEPPLGQEIVFLGNGDGTFQSSPKVSAGVYSPQFAAVGDFNGDGRTDIVISGGGCPSCQTSILLGNGDGSFQAPVVLFPLTGPIAASDLNGDGKLDLVFSGDGGAGQIYLGNGDGTFANLNDYFLSWNPYSPDSQSGIAIADFNSDGKLDVAVANCILLSNGNGTFQGAPLGNAPGVSWPAFAFGDFEGNGSLDVAQVTDDSVFIFHNDGSGALSLLNTYLLPQPGASIVAADFNGDGKIDLAVLEQYDDTGSGTLKWAYSVLLGNGNGSFQMPVYNSEDVGASSVYNLALYVADFNNDHKPDLAVVGLDNQSLGILLGKGDGTFASPAYYYNAGSTSALIADFNSDGNLDVAAPPPSGASNPSTGILYGKGDGTFQALTFPASLNNYDAVFTADFNNDGKADFLSATNSVALGNGDGTFTLLSPGSFGLVQSIGDYNGDGKLDLFVSSAGVVLGNGDGTFGPVISVAVPAARAVLSEDVNNDGHTDLLFSWLGTHGSLNAIGVFLNTTPGFAISSTLPSPSVLSIGGSAKTTVSSVPAPGFNTAVALSCAGLPAGAICAFNPSNIANAAGISQLTIATTSAIAAGSYTIQVVGTAGSTLNRAAVTLVVEAVPDFSIHPASGSTSQTVSAGQTASFSLSLQGSGTFSGTVNLSCAVTPAATAGPTCILSSSSEQISGTTAQTVTVKVATTAPSTTAMLPLVGIPPTSLVSGWTMLYGTILAGFVWLALRSRKRVPALFAPLLLLAAVSCGGGGSSSSHNTPGTPAGTYTATVTATSATLSHTMALQVTVQ